MSSSSVSQPSSIIPDRLSPAVLIPPFKCSNAGKGRGPCYRRHATIETLPYDIPPEIFSFYLDDENPEWVWHKLVQLVHVCRRWRNVVFASPRRLNLQLFCTHKLPVRETLDNWPALPIIVFANARVVVTISSLPHSNMTIAYAESPSKTFQVPFPALTYLELWSADEIALVLPESFLGGCVPGLRSLELGGIQFPAVRKLLLSDISPEAMTTSLSTLTKLETLHLGFLSPQSRPNQTGRRLPPLKRILLPALTSLWF
ncbi:hypothetical protein BJV74DRAFT_884171 [Russula compacta]|nr:hypothetical protein BJV74DRAFT_884171 [Russula compacta]